MDAKAAQLNRSTHGTAESLPPQEHTRPLNFRTAHNIRWIAHTKSNMRSNRVHTQFWADLNNRIDITKLENEVWAKMHADPEQGRNDAEGNAPSTASAVLRRTQTVTTGEGAGSRRAAAAADCDSVRPSSKDSSRLDVASSSKDADEQATAASVVDETAPSASPSKALAGILGYEELGHVPTLDEFRSEWTKMRRSQSDFASPSSPGDGGVGGGSKGYRWRQQGQGAGGQPQQQGPGSVVNELSKRDEVFRHFKKYYDKADHAGGRVGDALFPAGVNSTGLLQPDFEVIEAVGRHTAQTLESRGHSRVGEGLLSTPGSDTGADRRDNRGRRRSRENIREADNGGGGGLTNVFLQSALGSEGFNQNSDPGAVSSFLSRSRNSISRPGSVSQAGDVKNSCLDGAFSERVARASRPGRGVGGVGSPHSNSFKAGADGGRAKASLEGSSTSAELQVSGVEVYFIRK